MKYKVAFVCVHNSCRSQMAEGMLRSLGSDIFDVYSAGTEAYPAVKPMAVEVMQEIGIDISSHKPKLLADIPASLDILITMGCNVTCPFVPSKHRADWGLSDPSGGSMEDFRKTRELIKSKASQLIEDVKSKKIVL